MNDETRQYIQGSLFSSTSAFDGPSPEEVAAAVTPAPRADTLSPSQHLKKIANLIEDAMDAVTDTELLPILEEALELARREDV